MFAATVDQDVLCGQLLYCWCLAEGHSSFVESCLRLDKGSLGDVWQYLPAEVRQALSHLCVRILRSICSLLWFLRHGEQQSGFSMPDILQMKPSVEEVLIRLFSKSVCCICLRVKQGVVFWLSHLSITNKWLGEDLCYQTFTLCFSTLTGTCNQVSTSSRFGILV